MKNLDVLLIARPGRAQRIYESLLDSEFKFKFITFKVFPQWLKKLTGSKKMQVKGPFTNNLLIFTLYDYLKFKPRGKWLSVIKERPFFELFLKPIISHNNARLIHYWPNYCYKSISNYKKKHPSVITFADVYLPCEKFIVDEIAPKLELLGVGMNVDYIRKRAELLDEVMACENNFICQSEYVANTYRKYYPDKNYYIINNGLSISSTYKMKTLLEGKMKVTDFVYCGKVSVEKGCDLLMQWFSNHNEFHIHLFGKIETAEKNKFSVYESIPNIHFHGSVPKDELQKVVSRYDAGIHLSRYDAWSIAVGEILGAGLPVVVSDQTGISELVRDKDFGEVCQLNEDSITDCINKLINPQRYNQCINNINDFICSKPKSYGEKVIDFYKDYINK